MQGPASTGQPNSGQKTGLDAIKETSSNESADLNDLERAYNGRRAGFRSCEEYDEFTSLVSGRRGDVETYYTDYEGMEATFL